MLVGVLVAQADILQGGPVAGRRLEVAVVLQIERMGLNGFEEPPCLLRRTRVIRRACVFAQSVNGESQRIELLARIGRRAVGTYRPIDSAEFRVDEVVEEVVARAGRWQEQLPASCHPIGGREGPYQAAVKYGALIGVGIERAVAGYASVETAFGGSHHPFGPKGQNIVL